MATERLARGRLEGRRTTSSTEYCSTVLYCRQIRGIADGAVFLRRSDCTAARGLRRNVRLVDPSSLGWFDVIMNYFAFFHHSPWSSCSLSDRESGSRQETTALRTGDAYHIPVELKLLGMSQGVRHDKQAGRFVPHDKQ